MYYVERSRGSGTNARKIYGNFIWATIQVRGFRLGKSRENLVEKECFAIFSQQYFADLL
jgi:hypothetical protein